MLINNSVRFIIPSLLFQKLQILSVDDLNSALREFVNEDDKTAFHAFVQQNIEEAIVRYATSLHQRKTSLQLE